MANDLPVGDLPNIGSVLANELEQVGISTAGELDEAGSVEAFRRIRGTDAAACYNMLYALEGAVQRMRWHSLAADERRRLKKAVKGIDDPAGRT